MIVPYEGIAASGLDKWMTSAQTFNFQTPANSQQPSLQIFWQSNVKMEEKDQGEMDVENFEAGEPQKRE